MTDSKHKKTLDELLSGAVDLRLQPDFAEWRQKHPEALEALRAVPTTVNSRRRNMVRIVRYSTSAAAVILLLIAGAWWAIFTQGVATPWEGVTFAFADVQKAVSQVRSVTFTLTNTGWGGQPFADPLIIKVTGLELDRYRAESSEMVNIINFRDGLALVLWPRTKKATVWPLYPRAKDSPAEPLDFLKHLRNIPATATKRLGERELERRKVVDFVWRNSGEDYTVSVDAATRLPVRMEISRMGPKPFIRVAPSQPAKDEGRKEPEIPKTGNQSGQPLQAVPDQALQNAMKQKVIREVCSDFQFDIPVDELLFDTTPPEGYEVRRFLPDPNADAHYKEDAERLVVSPTSGIGPVQFGMSREEVIRLLGKPDGIDTFEAAVAVPTPSPVSPAPGKKFTSEGLEYNSRGFAVRTGILAGSPPSVGVVDIDCFNQVRSGPIVREFAGRTPEGIRLGASWDDVLRAYGKPDCVLDGIADGMRAADGRISYMRLGWEFDFYDKKLCRIRVRQPPRGVEGVDFEIRDGFISTRSKAN